MMAQEFVISAGSTQLQRSNRRTIPRFDVDENATLLLVNHGSKLPCRVVDVSLGGCRIYAKERFQGGILVRVEISFKVRGLAFRFSGVTQWTDSRHMLGVKFVGVVPRRLEELAEALGEVEALNAAKTEKLAAEKRVEGEFSETQILLERSPDALLSVDPSLKDQTIASVIDLQETGVKPSESMKPSAGVPLDAFAGPKRITGTGVIAAPVKLSSALPLPTPTTPKPANSAGRERRAQSRQGVDTSAVIFLIKIAAKLPGRILDLSLGGCRIRTDERFPVGIYTRVETEFRLEGLPFRLAGVVQAIHDRHQIGIRFLDMSPRKKDQVAQLIAEIEEMHKDENDDVLFPVELSEEIVQE